MRENFPLLVGQTTRADITLEVGQVSETVEVEAAAPQLKPETSELSTSVGQKQIQDLPLPMSGEARSPINFIALVPGVTGAQSGGGYGNNTTGRTFATSVNGGQTFAVMRFRWMERHSSRRMFPGTSETSPSLRMPSRNSKWKRVTLQPNSDAPRGGIISFTTRSGTNDYHGSVYDYFRNNVLDARGFYAASTAKLNQNEYGGNIGGPVLDSQTLQRQEQDLFLLLF